MDYRSLSFERKSERDFRKKLVPEKALGQIMDYFNECKRLIPDIDVELRIYNKEAQNALNAISGYRGFMIGAPCYLVLLSEQKDYFNENAGFIGEDLVLKATELGLDSCWVTYGSHNEAKNALDIESDKLIAGLIAIGYEKHKFINRVIDIKSMSDVEIDELDKNRLPRISIDEFVHIPEWDGKETLDIENVLSDVMESARRAPTYLNMQPYRFIIDGEYIVLVAKQDPEISEGNLKLGAGILMLHVSGVAAQLMKDIQWIFGENGKDYHLPSDYAVLAYFKL